MNRNFRRFVILAMLLLAFALRLYRLDYFSLRGDESFTVLFVQKSFAQMWEEIRTVEPNPPLMYLLLRGWVVLAGASEFTTRFFSVGWGVLGVALIYRVAREIFAHSFTAPAVIRGRGLALGAAFLFAINPYQIWHSQDVRNYTMWPALSLLALVFLWEWIRTARRLYLLWFVVAELAALYTHYYEAFILLALNIFVFVWLWIQRAPRDKIPRAIFHWTGAQVVLALLYLPWTLFFSNRVSSYGEGSGQKGVALWDIGQRTFSSFMLGETLEANARAAAWVVLALALVLILIYLARQSGSLAAFFLLYVGVPTLAVFILNLARPLFLERYLNGIAPAYYLLFAFGVSALVAIPRRRFVQSLRVAALAFFSLLALLALSNYFYNPAYAKSPDWRGLARILATQRQDGDIILQNFPETSLVYYDRSHLPLVVYPKDFFPDADTARALNEMNSKYRRVWFIPAAPDFWDPDQFVEGWLDRHADLLIETRVSSLRAKLYGTPAEFLAALTAQNVGVGNFARLLGYRLQPDGPNLRVTLFWRALQRTPNSYTVFVHLLDRDGRLLAQKDQTPVHGSYPTNQWKKDELVVDQYILAGAGGATLEIGMYDPATLARLPMTDLQNQPRGDTLRLPLTP